MRSRLLISTTASLKDGTGGTKMHSDLSSLWFTGSELYPKIQKDLNMIKYVE